MNINWKSMPGLAVPMTATVTALTLAVVTIHRNQSGYVTSNQRLRVLLVGKASFLSADPLGKEII
jgi:hypothetical protein